MLLQINHTQQVSEFHRATGVLSVTTRCAERSNIASWLGQGRQSSQAAETVCHDNLLSVISLPPGVEVERMGSMCVPLRGGAFQALCTFKRN